MHDKSTVDNNFIRVPFILLIEFLAKLKILIDILEPSGGLSIHQLYPMIQMITNQNTNKKVNKHTKLI